MDTPDDLKLLRVSEVARLFNISRPTIYRMVKSGQLEGFTVCGSVRIAADSVASYLESHRVCISPDSEEMKIDTAAASSAASPKKPIQLASQATTGHAAGNCNFENTETAKLKSRYISDRPAVKTHAAAPAQAAVPKQPHTKNPVTGEMLLQRKAWKMARTLAIKILPANASAEKWDQTLKLAYEQIYQKLLAAAKAKTKVGK